MPWGALSIALAGKIAVCGIGPTWNEAGDFDWGYVVFISRAETDGPAAPAAGSAVSCAAPLHPARSAATSTGAEGDRKPRFT
jgi:hypothetical protein